VIIFVFFPLGLPLASVPSWETSFPLHPSSPTTPIKLLLFFFAPYRWYDRYKPRERQPMRTGLAGACQESLLARERCMASPNERHFLNLLRHEYTTYHGLLQTLVGRVDCWDAYRVIKERVNGEVTERLRGEAL